MKNIYEAFNNKFESLKSLYNIKDNLSLKFIVHYGEINVYNIKGFKKLYGQTVIESHCLLKNGEGNKDYILITEDYFKALDQTVSVVSSANWKYTTSGAQSFTGLRRIEYSFYNYSFNNTANNHYSNDYASRSLYARESYAVA
jgi:choline kinase